MKYNASTPIASIDLAAPAVRALQGSGYHTLKDVAKINDADLVSLHGFGPKALRQLTRALADAGLRDPVDTKPNDPGPLLSESGYVQVGDLNMYYETGGKGEPLVMLHGGMLQSGCSTLSRPCWPKSARLSWSTSRVTGARRTLTAR